MPKKVSFIILFLSVFLPAAGDAPYQKVAGSGMDVYYREFGAGTPILVLGGGPGDASDRYLSLCEGLAKSHRCILVDQRGTGKSLPAVLDPATISIAFTLEDFEAVRKSLGLKQWAVLGFSYGGYLASLYAHFHPGSVSRLVLLGSLGLNTGAFPHFMDNIASRLRPADSELFDYWNDPERTKADPKHALVERIRARMPGYFFDRKKSLLVSQAMQDGDFNFDMGSFIWQDIEKRDLDLAKMRSKFANPVLILHGRQDPLGESVPQQLSRYYGNAKLVFIEKCGHYSWIEQPEEIFSAVKEFLGKDDFPKLSVPGLGQKPPEVFAPGVISLPGRIEFCLALSPDGNETFFAIRKNPGQWEIHRSERRNGAWQPSITAPFSGSHSDLEPTFSPDGRRLFFSSNRPLEGQACTDGFHLWLVERQDGGWSLPRPLPAPINGPGDQWRASQGRSGRLYYSSTGLWSCPFAEGKAGQPQKLFDPQSPQGLIGGHAFVSPEEDYLLTAWMDGPGHRGGWDIYISFRDRQGNWSPSVNLGDAVNTPAGEDFPLVAPGGRDLYFFRYQKSESGEESGDIFRIDAGFLQMLRAKALFPDKQGAARESTSR